MTDSARETIATKIWREEPEPDNPFAARIAYCSGFDVYGDLLGRISWVQYLWLLIRLEPPTAAQAQMLEALAVGIANPGPHGFSEVLYAFSSAGNNNGSAFAGLGANTPFYNLTLGLAMLVARYWLMVPILAIAGSMAAKRVSPVSAGTLPTHGPLFVVLLISVVVVVGALTFIPALALGPIVEQLQMNP